MPIYDTKRAYLDHIKTLSSEQRKTFGTNLKNALDGQIAEVRNILPPPGPNENPYNDAQLVGERVARGRNFAQKLESGVYALPAAGENPQLETDLAALCGGLDSDDEAFDNAVFNELLREAKDPVAYQNRAAPQTAKGYQIDRKAQEREHFFAKYPEIKAALGGKEKLTQEEIAAKRSENPEQRNNYAKAIENILNVAYANAYTKAEADAVSKRISKVFSSIPYNIGLNYQTGIDLGGVAHSRILMAAANSVNMATKQVDRDKLKQALAAAARQIADLDLHMYFADKLEGIRKYVEEEDPAHLDAELEPAFMSSTGSRLVQESQAHAGEILARPRVSGRKSAEEISELMLRGYLDVRGDNNQRMRYLASLHGINPSPLMKDEFLYSESLSLFVEKLIRCECMTDGAPDAEKFKRFVYDTADFLFNCQIQIGSAREFDGSLEDPSALFDAFTSFEFGDFRDGMNELAHRLQLPSFNDMQRGYMTLMMNRPENALKRGSYGKRTQAISFLDPVEQQKKELFENEGVKDYACLTAAAQATALINAVGGAVFVDDTDARDIRSALSILNRAAE